MSEFNLKDQANTRQLKPSKKYMCDQCPFKTAWYPFLTKHMDVRHGAKVYSCDKCTFTCNAPNDFKRHKRYGHQATGGKFPCDQCDYAGTRADALRLHIASQHEGVRYPCDVCNYTATTKGDLGRHRQAIHEKIRFPCDYCEFTSASKAYTKRHVMTKHNNAESVKNEFVQDSMIQEIFIITSSNIEEADVFLTQCWHKKLQYKH